jgi:hypothetical protein
MRKLSGGPHLRSITIFCGLICFWILLTPLFGAESQPVRCGIRGDVLDQSGMAVSSAVVKAEHAATGKSYTTVASKTGVYSLRDLPSGAYQLTAMAPGFQIARTSTMCVEAGATRSLSLELKPAAHVTTLQTVAPESR